MRSMVRLDLAILVPMLDAAKYLFRNDLVSPAPLCRIKILVGDLQNFVG